MLDTQKIVDTALETFGLSLLDDPTAWPEPTLADLTFNRVQEHCNAVAHEGAYSALASALGRIAEAVATDIDVAIAEDGPLADVDDVLARYMTGLAVDLAPVVAAPDWTARVEAMRDAFAAAVASYKAPPLATAAVRDYIASDKRLSGLATGPLITLPPPNGTDDTPAVQAAVTQACIPGLLRDAGFTDIDAAAALGLTRPYFSMIASGKRPWPGLKPGALGAVRQAVDARADAMEALINALDSLE